MCKDDIEVIIKIPITDKPDINGYVYPREILEKAISKFNNGGAIPLVVAESQFKLGNINNISIEDNKLIFTATGICGGTCEDIEMSNDNSNNISDMAFMHVGIVPDKSYDYDLEVIEKIAAEDNK